MTAASRIGSSRARLARYVRRRGTTFLSATLEESTASLEKEDPLTMKVYSIPIAIQYRMNSRPSRSAAPSLGPRRCIRCPSSLFLLLFSLIQGKCQFGESSEGLRVDCRRLGDLIVRAGSKTISSVVVIGSNRTEYGVLAWTKASLLLSISRAGRTADARKSTGMWNAPSYTPFASLHTVRIVQCRKQPPSSLVDFQTPTIVPCEQKLQLTKPVQHYNKTHAFSSASSSDSRSSHDIAFEHNFECGNSQAAQATQRLTQPPVTSQRSHINVFDEWAWPINQGVTAPFATNEYTSAPASNLGTAPYQQNIGFGFELSQIGPTENEPIRIGADVCSVWPSQSIQLSGLTGAANILDPQDSMTDLGIDFDVPITLGTAGACVHDYPVSPREALPTPGLVHSPSNARILDASPSASGLATARSASTSSVPATPTNFALLELDGSTQPNVTTSASKNQQQIEIQGHWNAFNDPPNALGLASAFGFTNLVSTPDRPAEALPTSKASTTISSDILQPRSQCLCSVALERSSSNFSSLNFPASVATPAPGWLDPNATPNEMLVGSADVSLQAPNFVPTFQHSAPPDGWAVAPMTTTICSGHDFYRNSSVASTASNSSQTYTFNSPVPSARQMSSHESNGGTRRRSLTMSSLSGHSSCLVDRVRVMSVARSQPSGGPHQGVSSAARIASPGKYNSMPRLRTRPSAPALSSAFSIDTKGTGSLRERSSGGSRSRLSGLFVKQGSDASMCGGSLVQPSPTMSDSSQDFTSPTSLFLAAAPPTPLEASFSDAGQVGDVQADDLMTDAETVNRAKIAVHHHRTKLQRSVLNEVVISLQGAYKHCRRQILTEMQAGRIEQGSILAAELTQLDSMQEELCAAGDDEPRSSVSGAVVAGETREMRKNRQKAESKMRMRRKEVAQFAALTTYARIALPHSVGAIFQTSPLSDGAIGHSLAQVFLEHRQEWTTLIALEKRLFHTVRVKLGLQELMVKKLLESLESTFVSV
ncbi:hypothetical protein PHSY_002611 [Pseudozyma hubeiensis SY62]|uniref:Uncharacterized protein n=1 Tax=Pseudozyma hubeiensis (strain SY62) TaxID=1305764 RepID=R9P1D3_PSEHS|nr:hypothetical protein PHSY_002611 [Pseudozyma hubeiensis SY62]GAC95036.1 hypothetical protein PHSY_002611 [Pseudozyma hubeiensis SY62]